LDFARLFERPELRSTMRESLFSDFAHYGVVMHAYVVMPHHLHFVARTPMTMDAQSLVARVKKNSADRLLPMLTAAEKAQLSDQTGLNGRKFWKRSFRSLVLEREQTFWQKVGYVHENPLQAGLCRRAEDYLWSSAGAFVEGRWTWELGCLEACRDTVDRVV